MTLVETIEGLSGWLTEHVCSQISLKEPNDDINDAEYEVKYIHPTAFPLYIPGRKYLPPGVSAPTPAICVQFLKGTDDIIKRQRKVDIQLSLSCWNPGEHGNELYTKQGPSDDLTRFRFLRKKAGTQSYVRNLEGWRDVVNFVDLTVRTLEGVEAINGQRIMTEDGIEFGMFQDDEGGVWEFYPQWMMYVKFALESGTTPKYPAAYEQFL